MPLAINYAYLESQSQRRTEHRDNAARLRAGLAGVEELRAEEVADALGVVGKYGRDETLSEAESQRLEFVRKLVDGAIDAKMYRAGAGQRPPASPEAGPGAGPAARGPARERPGPAAGGGGGEKR